MSLLILMVILFLWLELPHLNTLALELLWLLVLHQLLTHAELEVLFHSVVAATKPNFLSKIRTQLISKR